MSILLMERQRCFQRCDVNNEEVTLVSCSSTSSNISSAKWMSKCQDGCRFISLCEGQQEHGFSACLEIGDHPWFQCMPWDPLPVSTAAWDPCRPLQTSAVSKRPGSFMYFPPPLLVIWVFASNLATSSLCLLLPIHILWQSCDSLVNSRMLPTGYICCGGLHSTTWEMCMTAILTV